MREEDDKDETKVWIEEIKGGKKRKDTHTGKERKGKERKGKERSKVGKEAKEG